MNRLAVLLAVVMIVAGGCGSEEPPPEEPQRKAATPPTPVRPAGKVLILGLDGADWTILDRLEGEGRIPNLARLRAEGASGVLLSEQPLLSPIVWTTIATGRHPLDHGIVGFLTVRNGRTEPVRSDERKVRAFWNVASDYGLKVGVIGWYASWPAESVNGFLISDRVGHHQVAGEAVRTDTGLAYPPSLMPEVSRRWAEVEAGIGKGDARRFFGAAGRPGVAVDVDADRLDAFVGVIRTTELYRGLLPGMMKRYDPDIAAVYFEGTDSVGHLFAEYADEPLPGVDREQSKYLGQTFYRFYEYIDTVVGEIASGLDPSETTLIVVSDHGFKTGDARPGITGSTTHTDQAPVWHRPEGVILMWGRGVRKGIRLPDTRIYDLAPTVFRAVGVPLAGNLEGRPIEEAFEPAALPEPIAGLEDYEALGARELPADAELPAGEALERLRALGYIGEEEAPALSEGQSGVPLNLYNLGVVLLNSGRREEALRTFRKMQEESPGSGLGFLGEGLVHLQVDAAVEAVRVLERAVDLGGEIGAIHEALGEAYVAAGEPGKAGAALERALALNPSDGRAALILARLKMVGRDYRRAGALFEKARRYAEKPVDRADGCVGLAILAEEAGSFPRAAAYYEESLQHRPDFPRALERFANLQLYRKRPAEAAALLARLVELKPRNAAIAAMHGRALAMAGRFEDARSALRRSLELEPAQPETRSLLESLPKETS